LPGEKRNLTKVDTGRSLAILVKLSDSLADMKKIPARQFQKQFGKVTNTLKPGDVVQVTMFGAPHVQITRLGRRRIATPDFAANLAKLGYSQKLGDQILKEFNDALS
jgi:hypothetical protein